MFVHNPLYVNVFFVVICCCFLLKEKIQRYNFFSIAPKNVSFYQGKRMKFLKITTILTKLPKL